MKGWRTIAFNAAVALLPAVDYVANNGSVIKGLFADPEIGALVVVLITAANMVLRAITTGPVGKK